MKRGGFTLLSLVKGSAINDSVAYLRFFATLFVCSSGKHLFGNCNQQRPPGNHPSAVPRQSSAACAYCAVAHSDGDASGNPPGGSTPRITEQRTQCGYSSSDTEGKGRSTISVIAASEACPVGSPEYRRPPVASRKNSLAYNPLTGANKRRSLNSSECVTIQQDSALLSHMLFQSPAPRLRDV